MATDPALDALLNLLVERIANGVSERLRAKPTGRIDHRAAAHELQLTPATVLRHLRAFERDGGVVQRVGRRRMVDIDELRTWLDRRAVRHRKPDAPAGEEAPFELEHLFIAAKAAGARRRGVRR